MSEITGKYSGEGENRTLELEIENDYLSLNRHGELSGMIREEIGNGVRNFSFNLRKLESINSSGLGILIACLKRIKDSGCSLKLTNVNEKVIGIFKLTRLNNVFEFEASN